MTLREWDILLCNTLRPLRPAVRQIGNYTTIVTCYGAVRVVGDWNLFHIRTLITGIPIFKGENKVNVIARKREKGRMSEGVVPLGRCRRWR